MFFKLLERLYFYYIYKNIFINIFIFLLLHLLQKRYQWMWNREKHNCENADCFNTDGSFKCLCHVGYDGNGQELCEGNLYNILYHVSTIVRNYIIQLPLVINPQLYNI